MAFADRDDTGLSAPSDFTENMTMYMDDNFDIDAWRNERRQKKNQVAENAKDISGSNKNGKAQEIQDENINSRSKRDESHAQRSKKQAFALQDLTHKTNATNNAHVKNSSSVDRPAKQSSKPDGIRKPSNAGLTAAKLLQHNEDEKRARKAKHEKFQGDITIDSIARDKTTKNPEQRSSRAASLRSDHDVLGSSASSFKAPISEAQINDTFHSGIDISQILSYRLPSSKASSRVPSSYAPSIPQSAKAQSNKSVSSKASSRASSRQPTSILDLPAFAWPATTEATQEMTNVEMLPMTQQVLTQIQDMQFKVEQYQSENATLTEENERFRLEITDLRNELSDLQKTKKALTSQVATFERKQKALAAENEKHVREIADMKKTHKAQLAAAEQGKIKIASERNSQLAEIAELKAAYKALEEERNVFGRMLMQEWGKKEVGIRKLPDGRDGIGFRFKHM